MESSPIGSSTISLGGLLQCVTLSLCKSKKKLRQRFVDQPFVFHSGNSVLAAAIRQNRVHFWSQRWSPLPMNTKVVSFSHFPRALKQKRINPLWGLWSISIDSDLGALQPYFLVVMVTPGSPFFACMQLNDKRSCWRFEKSSVLQKKLSFWPSEVVLPSILAPCSGVVRSSCLGVWFAELELNGLPALDSSCDLDDSVLWRSIFRSERTLPSWRS